jgi:hypothetical protein
MYVCILDQRGEIPLYQNMKVSPEAFLRALTPYRADIAVAVACIFTWYWLADLCAREGIPFVHGHALSMQASHGGKATHDKVDTHKIAVLLHGGMLPQAYGYPAEMHATRDRLRRRMDLPRKRAELLGHVQHTNSQDNLPEIGKRLASKANRDGVAERLPDPAVQKSMAGDLALIDSSAASSPTAGRVREWRRGPQSGFPPLPPQTVRQLCPPTTFRQPAPHGLPGCTGPPPVG